jgi:hypothetical protein
MSWKAWVGAAFVVGAIVFVVARWHASFSDRPPDWLRQEDKQSIQLPDASLKNFKSFRKEVEVEAKQRNLPVGSIQFFEVARDGKEVIAWNSVKLTNQGFNPNAHFDQPGGGDETRLLGFYTLDGESLGFTVKHHPSRSRGFYAVVHLDKPLPPGESTLVLRIERRPLNIKPNVKGQLQYGLGRFAKPTAAIHGRAVSLPERAKLVRYRPDKGAFEFAGDPPLVGWINACLDTNFPPLSATFTLPR